MSDTIAITLDSACPNEFRNLYEATFTEWMNSHRTHTIEVNHGGKKTQETVVFDEALIMLVIRSEVSILRANITKKGTVYTSVGEAGAARCGFTIDIRVLDSYSMISRRHRSFPPTSHLKSAPKPIATSIYKNVGKNCHYIGISMQ